MAEADSTQPDSETIARLKPYTSVSLIELIGSRHREINEQMEQMSAVAFGGTAYAGSLDNDGNEIDITSRQMFDVINGLGSNARMYYDARDMIAELTRRLSLSEAVPGGAENSRKGSPEKV